MYCCSVLLRHCDVYCRSMCTREALQTHFSVLCLARAGQNKFTSIVNNPRSGSQYVHTNTTLTDRSCLLLCEPVAHTSLPVETASECCSVPCCSIILGQTLLFQYHIQMIPPLLVVLKVLKLSEENRFQPKAAQILKLLQMCLFVCRL